MLNWLKHAFAVDVPLPPLTMEQCRLIDRLALEIVRRRMTTPALAFLEMSRPLNYIGSQTMRFFEPVVSIFVQDGTYDELAKILERRDAIDLISRSIEQRERENFGTHSQDQER